MSTILSSSWKISGVIDTNKGVMSNVDILSTASGCWTTFDINEGKWSVVINRPGNSVKSFNDSNIIGSISVSTTGIKELYNGVQVEYPNKSIEDQRDTVVYTIDANSRYLNEQDNVLNFQIDCVNEPIQVEALAVRELKQSRIDKVIEFRTDFTSLGLKAGDIIDVTASMYGFSAKKFRILSIQEEDGDDGVLALSITAIEYDEGIYNTSGLTRKARTSVNNIIAKSCNAATTANDNKANLPLDLSNVAKALGLLLTFNALTGRWELSQGGQQVNIAADHSIIKWTFNDGVDLDIRCRVAYPNVGQNTLDQYIGYTGSGGTDSQFPTGSTAIWPPSGVPILIWGGDNTGPGEETVYVNLERLKELYPGEQYFIIECRGNWYRYQSVPTVADLPAGAGLGTILLVEADRHNYILKPTGWFDQGLAVGMKPVLLTAEMYEGGTVVPPASGSYTWTVNGYAKGKYVEGVSTYINSNFGEITVGGFDGTNAPGDLMGYFVFDPYNDVGYFRNDLTGLF